MRSRLSNAAMRRGLSGAMLLFSAGLLGCDAGTLPSVGAPARPAVPVPSQTNPEDAVLADLGSYLVRFTGDAPLDCGRDVTSPAGPPAGPEVLRQWLSCALDAAKQRQPVLAYRAYRSLDHIGVSGLLGTADGGIFQFQYDSGHFFVGRWWNGVFRITRCPEPLVTDRPGPGAVFACPGQVGSGQSSARSPQWLESRPLIQHWR